VLSASWIACLFGGTPAIKPLLSGLKAREARSTCFQIDTLPFRVEARRLQFVDPTEELVDKTRNPPIPQ